MYPRAADGQHKATNKANLGRVRLVNAYLKYQNAGISKEVHVVHSNLPVIFDEKPEKDCEDAKNKCKLC